MRDLGLELEDGAHQLRELGVDVDDLLELVEDERDLSPALCGELAGKLEEPLERRVEILWLAARVEAEAELAARSGRRSRSGVIRRPEKTRSRSRARKSVEARSSWIVSASFSARRSVVGVVMRLTWATSTSCGDRLLRHAPHERRLAVAPRGEDDDVLAVQDVGQELLDLGFAIGEGLVEGERAVAERVRRHRTERSIGYAEVRYACVRNARTGCGRKRRAGAA